MLPRPMNKTCGAIVSVGRCAVNLSSWCYVYVCREIYIVDIDRYTLSKQLAVVSDCAEVKRGQGHGFTLYSVLEAQFMRGPASSGLRPKVT
jgi:hypothetical protein